MSILSRILLFLIVVVSLSSCIFQPRPYKHWYTKRGVRYTHYHHKGNMVGGRRFWAHHYGTY